MDETLTMVLHPGRTHGNYLDTSSISHCERNPKTLDETLTMFPNPGRKHTVTSCDYKTCLYEQNPKHGRKLNHGSKSWKKAL